MEPPALVLRGRDRELAVLGSLLERAARASSVLVVAGEPGIGKTAAIGEALRRAPGDLRVVRSAAVETELELPYSGLHQLIAGLGAGWAELPQPHREALDVAFGRTDGRLPTPFLVGLAVLGLLDATSAEQPLVCFFDDAHLLDGASAQVLGFVARRLVAEPVTLLLAVRDADDGEFAGLPRMTISGLGEEDALAVFSQALPHAIDPRVREQLLTEARGNPLALRELPRALAAAGVAGAVAVPPPAPLVERLEQRLRFRWRSLPAPARTLLLLAALEPTGDPELVRRAAATLGLGEAAFDAAERAGLLQIGARVTLLHPLLRSAVCRAAAEGDRRRAHAALAGAIDEAPDRRAWHRAQATAEPDEGVAVELERCAVRARARGGAAAAASFLQAAAALTPGGVKTAQRLVAAAAAKHEAGMPAEALGLIAAADEGQLPPRERALADVLRIRCRYAQDRDASVAPALVAAARALLPADAHEAHMSFLQALAIVRYARQLEEGGEPGAESHLPAFSDLGAAVLDALGRPGPASVLDRVLRGTAQLAVGGYDDGVRLVREAFAALDPRAVEAPVTMYAGSLALDLWDVTTLRSIADALVDVTCSGGLLWMMPSALRVQLVVSLIDGDLGRAGEALDEIEALGHATLTPEPMTGYAILAAWQGDEDRAARRIAELRASARTHRDGHALATADLAEATLYNGLGRHEDALVPALRQLAHARELNVAMRTMSELVEAATRAGTDEPARAALAALESITTVAATPWALGELETARGRVAGNAPAAEQHFAAAIEHLEAAGLWLLQARAQLAYGEWLRRRRRRVDARELLRAAHARFSGQGAAGFAERAAWELAATGERARPRSKPADTVGLTAQERNVARLAREGLTNREIGTRLFISDRTVEHHLRRVYAKLGINTRRALADALAPEP